MTTVFPTNNLPTAAQPWGREVQKQLTNLIASTNSERINNTARDNQLNSSIVALTGVVADVQVAAQEANDAINGLIGLGSAGSSYSIYADNISGGTITGVNLVSEFGIRKISISDGTIYFSENNNISGAIQSFSNFVLISDSLEQSQIYIGGNQVTLTGGNIYSNGNLTVYGNIGASGYTVSASTVSASTVSASSVNGGDGTFNTALRSSDIPTNPLGGGAVDVFATSSVGRLGVPTSARRTKQEIEDIELDVDAILSIKPQVFKYNVDVDEFGLENAPKVVGFIAEDLIDANLEYFVQYDKDGLPWTIPYSKYVVALQAVVRNLNDRITALENGA